MPGKQTRRHAKADLPPLTAATATGLFAAHEHNELATRITGIGESGNPEKPEPCQRRARYWYENNGFVREILKLRIAFYDFGFKVEAAQKKHKADVEAWALNVERIINQYRSEVWPEFLVQDAAVGLWRQNGLPLVYPIEKCQYSDEFGEEKLVIQHNLSDSAIDQMAGLSAVEKAALKQGQRLTLTKNNAAGKIFQFDVLKRARRGDGFGLPAMKAIFTCLAQFESLEVGDNLFAGLGRDVIMQLKIGHEIKNGPFAGNKIHFCTQAKADAAMKQLKGKKGIIFVVTNFDQNFEFPRPDVKHFDAKKYDGALKRLMLWAMPVAQLVLERALNPNVMQVFKQQALFERNLMAGHLNAVLNGMNPPAPVRVRWSNRCFADSRLFADLLKFNYQSGAISQTTVRQDSGYEDHDEELARKQAEAALAEGQKTPPYDPNHSKPEKGAGKKAGTPDNP